MANKEVPVIDISPFYSGDPEKKQAVAAKLADACSNVGFFVITGHNIPKETIEGAWKASKEFFDMPLKDKQEVPMTSDYPYGYSGMAEEKLNESLGKKGGAPDLKESFQICIGPENPPASMMKAQWPSKPEAFRKAWTDYYRSLENLSATLLRIFALALKLPENWFEDKINRHVSALRALNYPHQEQEPVPGQLRASAHTDYGSLTILLQDDAPGGLQVQNKDGSWQDIRSPPNSFVVNLGDLMARWTNDAWMSTMHRVINPPRDYKTSTRRQSMAFFHNLNPDANIQCIETCHSETNPAKYAPITAWDLVMEKHAKSMGSYKG